MVEAVLNSIVRIMKVQLCTLGSVVTCRKWCTNVMIQLALDCERGIEPRDESFFEAYRSHGRSVSVSPRVLEERVPK